MPRKVPLRHRLAEKRKEATELRAAVSSLIAANHRARFESSLLEAWCDFMHWWRNEAGVEVSGLALLDEFLLVQELRDASLQPSGTVLETSSADEGLDTPLAPPGDPLALLREVCSAEPFPGVESMDLPQLLATYSQCVANISLNLAVHSNPFHPACDVCPTRELRRALIQIWQLLWSMFVHRGQQQLIIRFVYSNCITGQQTTDLHQKQYMWAIDRMGLSKEQRERIASGYHVFDRLLKPVLQQRIQLQQELAAVPVGSATELFGPAVLPAGMQRPCAADVEQQRQLLLMKQLQCVMQKAYLLEYCICHFTCGVVSLRQACQLMVDLYPLPCGATRVTKFIADEVEKQARAVQQQPAALQEPSTAVQQQEGTLQQQEPQQQEAAPQQHQEANT